MGSRLLFIYDGECPFCNKFAELLELKSKIPNITVKNARDNPQEIPKGYDMDANGAILIKDGEMLYGANAINSICSLINEPSDTLLEILKIIFKSEERSKFLFPILLIARRVSLVFKGVSRKIYF